MTTTTTDSTDSRLHRWAHVLSARFRWQVIALAIVVGLVHASSFVGVYVYDDISVFENEAYEDVASMDWFSWTHRPLGRISFALQLVVLGGSPIASHCINVMVHLICVCGGAKLIDLILRLRFQQLSVERRTLLVVGTALLWGVHPISTTVVTYVIQRYEALAAVGMVWSIVFWLWAFCEPAGDGAREGALAVKETPDRVLWLASFIAALFAFGSKESSAGIPLMLLMADRAVLRGSWKETFRHALGPVLLLVPVIVGAYVRLPQLMIRDNRTATVGYFLEGIDSISFIVLQPIVYLRYLKLAFLPTDLVLDYGWIPADFSSLFFLGALLWAVILVGVLVLWRTSRMAGWAASSALLVLATTSFVPSQDMIFEHRFYLPLFALIASLVIGLGSRERLISNDRVLAVGFVVVSVLLASQSLMRNLDYVTPLRLAEMDLSRQPDNPRATYVVTISDDHLAESQFELGIKKAIDLSAQRGFFYAGSRYKWNRQLGDLLFFRTQFDAAERYYRAALDAKNDSRQEAEVLMSLAIIESIRGNTSNADQLFERALALETTVDEQIRAAYEAHRQRNRPADVER